MFITTSLRILKAAFQNIARNAWLGAATVAVLILALLSVNVLVGVNTLLNRAVHILEEKVDVTVFFKPDAHEAVVNQARFFLEDLPQVRQVELVPPTEALALFRERHKNDEEILAALDELGSNPLGATVRIKARDTANYPFIIETLQNPQFADAIESRTFDDHSESINAVRILAANARFVGTSLIVVFALIGVLIVFNMVRVAIYTQREEIGIMRLVGASSPYIRFPFVIQGVALAIISILVSSILVAIAVSGVEPYLVPLFDGMDPGLRHIFFERWWELALLEGGGLALIVGVTSWAAAGKYLNR